MMLMEDKKCFEAGFTLAELLVSLAITSMLIAVVGFAYTSQNKSYNSLQDATSLQQEMRSALELMAKEIRMAGYDPTEKAKAKIVTATSTNFRFTQDIGGGAGGASNGKTDDPNEDIRYAINGSGSLGRETTGSSGSSGLQPIAENIDQLAFEYYLDDGTWTLNPADLTKIDAVKIMILGHSKRATGKPDTTVFRPPYESATPPTWTPANPGNFHWRMMSLVVQCRNLAIKK
jgi:type IV pilus assembly protein PilW